MTVSNKNLWRRVLTGGLVLLLLLTGVYDEQFFAFLTVAWQKIFELLGVSQLMANIQQGISGQVLKRSLPAVATYAALYIGTCLLILRLLLRQQAQWRLTLLLYTVVLTVYVVLLVLGRTTGNAVWAYKLARHLIDFLATPVPVAALLVLFKSGFGPNDSDLTTIEVKIP